MRIMINSNVEGIDAEAFVIKLFDAIKCAAATGNTLDIKFNREEVQALSAHINSVTWIEINE